MPEIVFDGFFPNPTCFTPPPVSDQKLDPCHVDVEFHVRGERETNFPILTLRRDGDQFVLDTSQRGHEIALGILKASRLSLTDPKLQSQLFYSVGIDRWFHNNHPIFVQSLHYQGPALLPLATRLKNFIVTGTLENPDTRQKESVTALIQDIFRLPPAGRLFFKKSLDTLLGETTKGKLLPEMRERAQAFLDLSQVYEKVVEPVSSMPPMNPLKTSFQETMITLLAHLFTGEESLETVKTLIDSLLPDFRAQIPLPQGLFAHLYYKMRKLEASEFFNRSAAAGVRLKETITTFEEAVEDSRAEIFGLPASEIYRRSLEIQILKAGRSGDLAQRVEEERKRVGGSAEWFQNEDNVKAMTQVILPALQWTGDSSSEGKIRIDPTLLQQSLGRLLSNHTVRSENWRLGALAVMRFLLGSDLNSPFVSLWDRHRMNPAPWSLSAADRQHLKKIAKTLTQNLDSRSQNSSALIWFEGGLCLAGLGLGASGVGLSNREITMGGSSLGGMGCGALLTHAVFGSKGQTVNDTVGGLLGAGLGLGLAWSLTGNSPTSPTGPIGPGPMGGNMGGTGGMTGGPTMDGRNTTTGRGP